MGGPQKLTPFKQKQKRNHLPPTLTFLKSYQKCLQNSSVQRVSSFLPCSQIKEKINPDRKWSEESRESDLCEFLLESESEDFSARRSEFRVSTETPFGFSRGLQKKNEIRLKQHGEFHLRL